MPLRPGKDLISCHWIYKIKTLPSGTIEHYKAHLVARGFTQDYDIKYEETFAPVDNITFVGAIIAIATTRGW